MDEYVRCVKVIPELNPENKSPAIGVGAAHDDDNSKN